MTVQLPPDLEHLIESKIQSGQFQSAADVVREALRRLDADDQLRPSHLRQLHEHIDQGLLQAERGELADGEIFVQDLIRHLDSAGS